MARLARGSSLVTARINPLPPRADPARAGIRGQIGILNHRVGALHGTIRHRRGRRPRLPGPQAPPLDGHAGKCRLLGSCGNQGQRRPWIFPRTGQPEMGKDPLNHGRVVDRGDQLHPPGAARTAQDAEVEGAAHQQSPRPVAGPGCALALRAGICRPAPLRAAIGDDVRPPARAGGTP